MKNSQNESAFILFIMLSAFVIISVICEFNTKKAEEVKEQAMIAWKSQPDTHSIYKLYMLGGHTRYYKVKHKIGDCVKANLYACYGTPYIAFELCNPGISHILGRVINVVDVEKVNQK